MYIFYMCRTSLSTRPSRVAGHISAAQINITLILRLPCNVSRSCTPSPIQECSNNITFPKMCIALFIPTNYMHKLTPYLFPSAQSCKKKEDNIHINKSVYSWLKAKQITAERLFWTYSNILSSFKHNVLKTEGFTIRFTRHDGKRCSFWNVVFEINSRQQTLFLRMS